MGERRDLLLFRGLSDRGAGVTACPGRPTHATALADDPYISPSRKSVIVIWTLAFPICNDN